MGRWTAHNNMKRLRDPKTSSEGLIELIHADWWVDKEVVKIMLSHPNANAKFIKKLYDAHKVFYLRPTVGEIAKHKATPLCVLRDIVKRDCYPVSVLASLIKNPKTPLDVISQFSNDKRKTIMKALIKRSGKKRINMKDHYVKKCGHCGGWMDNPQFCECGW